MHPSALQRVYFQQNSKEISWLFPATSTQVFLPTDCYVWGLNQYFVYVKGSNLLNVYDGNIPISKVARMLRENFRRAPPIGVSLVWGKRHLSTRSCQLTKFLQIFILSPKRFCNFLSGFVAVEWKLNPATAMNFPSIPLRVDVGALLMVLLNEFTPIT